jgi:hypothetical protein
MGLRDAKPQKGGEARIAFLGLVTVVTVSYFIEPMGRKNAKRMQLGGMQVIVLLARVLAQLFIPHRLDYRQSVITSY